MKKDFSRYTWLVVGLMFFITILNFVDRSAISFVIDPLKKEFHLTDTQFGMILSAFSLGYILFSSVGGWFVDKFGPRIVWPCAAMAWSLSLGLLGLATGLFGFFILRFFLGVAEGPHFPAISRTVHNLLPHEERAKALSISLAAIPISCMIGAPVTSYLVADFGWRAMFAMIASVGIIWAVVFYIFFKDRPGKPAHCETLLSTLTEKRKVDWRYIFTHPTLLANNIAYVSFGYMVFFATLWLPGYFSSQFHLQLKNIGWTLTIPWLSASIFLLLGGFLTDYLFKKTRSYRISHSYVIWISQLLSAICFLILSMNFSLGVTVALLSLGVGLGFMPLGLFFNINVKVGKEDVGFAQGITSSYFSLAGIIAPLLTGWLVDLTGNFRAAFLLMGSLTVLTVFVVIFFHHPDRE